MESTVKITKILTRLRTAHDEMLRKITFFSNVVDTGYDTQIVQFTVLVH